MNNRSDILNELAGLAPVLATLSQDMPYGVPPHYFDELADTIQEKLHNNEAYPALAFISKKGPYGVPDSYFESLPLVVLSKLQQEVETPQVPAGYFDALPARLLQKIRRNELAEENAAVAPLLNDISKASPFTVPAGYFESFTVNIPHTTATAESSTTVVSIQKNKGSLRWLAAASVVALGALLTWQLSSNKPTGSNNPAPAIAGNTNSVADSSNNSIQVALSIIDDSSLDAYLSDIGVSKNNRSALYYLNTNNFEAALKDFSEADLQDHLEEEPIPPVHI